LTGDGTAVERIASSAGNGLASLFAQPLRALAQTEGPILARSRWLMLASALAVLLLASLAVLTTSIAAALDREPELALLKALGWDDRRTTSLFLAEAALIGAAAGAVGALVGLFAGRALARDLFRMDLSFQPGVLVLSIVLGILIAMLGAWLPSIRVYRLQPAAILKAE
jgi:putative ABC transport system permease protein